MDKVFFAVLKRDLTISFLKRGHFFNNLAFFSITTLLLIFSLSHGKSDVNMNVLNVILLPYIFAALLSASEIFQADFNDSTLEQLLISGYSSVSIVLAKALAHWLQLFIILLISVPLLCFVYDINLNLFSVYLVFFLLSLSVSGLVTFASALTLKINNSSIISCLITMPLTIILLLYVSSILAGVVDGVDVSMLLADIKILSALALVIVIISTFACGYVLKKI